MENASVKHIVFYVKPINFTNLLFFQIFNDKKMCLCLKIFLKWPASQLTSGRHFLEQCSGVLKLEQSVIISTNLKISLLYS